MSSLPPTPELALTDDAFHRLEDALAQPARATSALRALIRTTHQSPSASGVVPFSFRPSFEMKCSLMLKIREHVQMSGLSQQAIATKLGVTQPRVSSLVNGEIDKFSLEMLVDAASELGISTSLSVPAALQS